VENEWNIVLGQEFSCEVCRVSWWVAIMQHSQTYLPFFRLNFIGMSEHTDKMPDYVSVTTEFVTNVNDCFFSMHF
jgi:hypothetical protein